MQNEGQYINHPYSAVQLPQVDIYKGKYRTECVMCKRYANNCMHKNLLTFLTQQQIKYECVSNLTKAGRSRENMAPNTYLVFLIYMYIHYCYLERVQTIKCTLPLSTTLSMDGAPCISAM